MPPVGYKKRRAKWTQEEIQAKAREWYELTGRSPTATDWHPGDARAAAQRSLSRAGHWFSVASFFEEGDWPWAGSAYKRFGGWNKMLLAAGLPLNQRGNEVEAEVPIQGINNLPYLVQQVFHAQDNPAAMKNLLLLLAREATAMADACNVTPRV